MKWRINHLEDGNIVFVTLLAPVGLEDVKQICTEAKLLEQEHKSRKCLLDHRGVEAGLRVSDIKKVPDILRIIKAVFLSKIAFLLDTPAPEIEKFGLLKDVLAKAWIHLELFTEEDAAIAWLKEDQ